MASCTSILLSGTTARRVFARLRTTSTTVTTATAWFPLLQSRHPQQHLACTRWLATIKMLSPEDRRDAISRLDAWKDTADQKRNAITKTFEFEDFQQAWSFMSNVAKVADEMDHHPEWFNVYNKVIVTLTTHDCNGVSQKDISLAETMDSCALEIRSSTKDPSGDPSKSPPLVFQSTCDLYDEYETVARVPSVSFVSLGGKKQFCGTAVTVKCFEDNSRVKELLEDATENGNGKGKVLVVDGGGSQRVALLGDLIAKKAVEHSWEGVIINGNVRDVEELRQLPLGVMALGTTPRKSVRRGEGQVNLPIHIGNVCCKPGDKVYADENGVLFLD